MRIAVLITGQFRDYKVNVINHIKHLIEPNNADVFIYACTKNTIHTTGMSNISHKYIETTILDRENFYKELSSIYGKYAKKIEIQENEPLSKGDEGTIGYFRKRMQNQLDNIRNGFMLATQYEKENNIKYDIFVRCRPDNSAFPKPLHIPSIWTDGNILYSTQFASGWKDPWFFSFANPKIFDIYSGFKYLEGIDDFRKDDKFVYCELAMIQYIESKKISIKFLVDSCRPYYGFDKTKQIVDFPFCNKKEKIINYLGELVEINS